MANVNKIIRRTVKAANKADKIYASKMKLKATRDLAQKNNLEIRKGLSDAKRLDAKKADKLRKEYNDIKINFNNKQISKMNTGELKQLAKEQRRVNKQLNTLNSKGDELKNLIKKYDNGRIPANSDIKSLRKQLNTAIEKEGSRVFDKMIYKGSDKDRNDFIKKFKQSEKTKIAYEQGKAVDITKTENFDETIKTLSGEKNKSMNKLSESQFNKVYQRRMHDFRDNTLNLTNARNREKQYREMFQGYGNLTREQQKEVWNEFEYWRNQSREGEFDSWQTLSVISYNAEAALQGKPTIEITGVGKYGLQYKVNAPAGSDAMQESEERLRQIEQAHEEIQIRRLRQANKK